MSANSANTTILPTLPPYRREVRSTRCTHLVWAQFSRGEWTQCSEQDDGELMSIERHVFSSLGQALAKRLVALGDGADEPNGNDDGEQQQQDAGDL